MTVVVNDVGYDTRVIKKWENMVTVKKNSIAQKKHTCHMYVMNVVTYVIISNLFKRIKLNLKENFTELIYFTNRFKQK